MGNKYEIKDDDSKKPGYIKLENIPIYIDDIEEIKGNLRLADIELYGRAIKIWIKSEDCTENEYKQTSFSYSKIDCIELFQFDDGRKLIEYGNAKIVTDDDGLSTLNDYSNFVEENIEYFQNEYDNSMNRNNNYHDINTLSGIEFENICQQLVSKMGFEVEPTKATGDGGIDLIAYNHQPFLEGKYIIQCKRYSGSVGEPILRDLYGVITSERANKGIIITTGYFTQSAISFAEGKPIELIDGDKFNNLIKQYEVNATTNYFSNHRDIKSVFHENILLDYEEYESMINQVSRNTNNDQLRAKLINYLFECISNADEKEEDKYIIFTECKKHIVKYINNNSNNNRTKFLKDLYMMLHMQISILEGKFDEAIHMFYDITKLKEFNISWSEISKPIDTIEIWKNGMYRYFFETLFNAIQVCNILNDTIRRDNITSRYKCMLDYETQRLEHSISTPIETRKQYLKTDSINDINKVFERQNQHWNREIDDIKNIYKISKVYILHDYALLSAYEVVYEVGQEFNNGSDKCDISINVETDTLIIDGFNYKALGISNITRVIQSCKMKL